MDYSATGAAKGKTTTETLTESPGTGPYVPISVNNGNANPANGTGSKANNSGISFNAVDKNYNLSWNPSCPVQGANSNNVLLISGNNNYNWVSGLTAQKYTYTTAAATGSGLPGSAEDGPFDITIDA
jgi:hypothetical protein